MPAQSYTYYVSSVEELQVLWNWIRKAEEKLRTTAPCTSTTLNGVVIHASAGVATSAQAMACAWEAHYLSACALTRLGIFPDSPSICGILV